MKNDKNIHYYDPARFTSSQDEPDGASFISLLLCSFGMFTRNKLVIWLAVFFILFNLLSDLALAALDPRARRGGAGEAA